MGVDDRWGVKGDSGIIQTASEFTDLLSRALIAAPVPQTGIQSWGPSDRLRQPWKGP